MRTRTVMAAAGRRTRGRQRRSQRGTHLIPAPTAEAAREAEEGVRAREERHTEGRARMIVRAIGGSTAAARATLGSWSS